MNKLNHFFLIVCIFVCSASLAVEVPTSSKAEKSIASVEVALKEKLIKKGLKYGSPIFIRIFKKPGVLEVWLENNEGVFIHFETYDICTFSGALGPKLKEGDNQSPEGFYFVKPAQLNPWSRFHLSFNLGYPNQYDRVHGRTGSALMVHGNCMSIGCYAMTDVYMTEIYALVSAALTSGQPFFRVHSFPFHLDAATLFQYRLNQWHAFWTNLKQGYDYFNEHKRPPNVKVLNGRYEFGG